MANIKLTVLSDKMRGTSFTLSDQQYTIGRSDSADITIAEGTVSGRHCTLTRTENGTYAVHDEGSTNGTRINGRKLEDESMPLENGDLLQIGSVEMMFENAQEKDIISEKTISVINLDDSSSSVSNISQMSNLNTQGGAIKRHDSLRSNKKHNAIFFTILGILGVAVVAILIFFILKVTGSAGK